jgi:hypothetical protein
MSFWKGVLPFFYKTDLLICDIKFNTFGCERLYFHIDLFSKLITIYYWRDCKNDILFILVKFCKVITGKLIYNGIIIGKDMRSINKFTRSSVRIIVYKHVSIIEGMGMFYVTKKRIENCFHTHNFILGTYYNVLYNILFLC